MTARIVFLCARGSSRSILAASILAAHAGEHWEVWVTVAELALFLEGE